MTLEVNDEASLSLTRLAGRPEGYKFDTVTFYDGEYFMGDQQNIFQDTPASPKDNLGRSLAILVRTHKAEELELS